MLRVGVLGVLVVLSAFFAATHSARILGLFASQSKSHLIVHMSLIRPMIERGHDVTIVTSQDWKEPTLKFRHIKVDLPPIPMDAINKSSQGIWKNLQMMTNVPTFMMESNNALLNDPGMKKLMAEGSFDLVVLGYFFNDFHIGVAAHFKCPIILNWMGPPFRVLSSLMGNPHEILYVPDVLTGLSQPMDFFARVKNVAFVLLTNGILKFMDYKMGVYYEQHFPSDKYTSYDDMKKNISLLFVNTYLNQGFIQPKVPAIIEVGGIQIKPKPDPLPEDIKNFIEKSKDGVVYFCLGSNLKGNLLSADFIQKVFNVLSKLKHNIIWKWDEDQLPGKSSNILYKKWLPQDDILAHPNIKLFITHGGAGGFAEAQYHGVPMLALPFFVDQYTNANKIQLSGYGLTLEPSTLIEEALRESILEILNNPKYRETVKAFSMIFKDRPMNARDTAAYWMEYVIRHRGAKHLQSPAVHMNVFQYYGLDIFAFFVLELFIIWKISKFVWKRTVGVLCRKFSSRNKTALDKKRK